jgi:Holliday junction resolvasome RuvABC endonuclease subunit
MLTRLLRLKSAPQPTDAADGVAAALTYCLEGPPIRLATIHLRVPRMARV